jgi:hypothetical protein
MKLERDYNSEKRFKSSKTYLFCADDLTYNTGSGDTLEIIEDDAIPSNNLFVLTMP